jgi:D-arginine dehydrogenase
MRVLDCSVVVIGGGIAGASVAAHLAEHTTVRLLEMEGQPGYHATGRSAAQFSETYGNSTIRALSRASRSFFFSPPAGFCSMPLVRPRADLIFARPTQHELLDRYVESTAPNGRVERLSIERTLELCPILRPDEVAGAILDGSAADIDVHALHLGYLKLLKARGGLVTTAAEVVGLEREADSWRVTTPKAVLRASVVVNAAGAWAGELGRMAGAQNIGLEPRRRTSVLVEPPIGLDTASWPMLSDIDETFYLKPDAGLLLLSPADETPSPACDAQPDDLDVAIAIDRLERATTLEVRRVVSKWAGLRSFVTDRSPCVGFDTRQPDFFWFAALGGYGIQTAPALSILASALVFDRDIVERFSSCGLDPADLAPSRLLARA